jgi:hypothetical protein
MPAVVEKLVSEQADIPLMHSEVFVTMSREAPRVQFVFEATCRLLCDAEKPVQACHLGHFALIAIILGTLDLCAGRLQIKQGIRFSHVNSMAKRSDWE